MLTVEHRKDGEHNYMLLATDKTVEHLDFEDALDLLTDVQDVVQKMEEREIELDYKRFADEYGDMYRLRRE